MFTLTRSVPNKSVQISEMFRLYSVQIRQSRLNVLYMERGRDRTKVFTLYRCSDYMVLKLYRFHCNRLSFIAIVCTTRKLNSTF